MITDLRLGRWQDALADVDQVDAVIVDPPYSARVHVGHDSAVSTSRFAAERRRGEKAWLKADGTPDPLVGRRALSYSGWTAEDVDKFVAGWAPRCRGWMVALSDSDLASAWRSSFERHGLTGFQPLPCLMPGMTVRLNGDGPSSWAIYANVARPKALSRWGTLPGGYHGSPGAGPDRAAGVIGGKPLWLMRAIVRDYTRPGDLIVDPCAGGATTLLAAAMEGRRSVGAEMDPATFAKAKRRLAAGYTPDLFTAAEVSP